jgi:hypothetical protein
MRITKLIGKIKRNKQGHELPDPKPIAPPVGWKKPVPIQERIAKTVREELSRMAEEKGMETFEDADDFDVPEEDSDFESPYELNFDPDEFPASDLRGWTEEQIEDPQAPQNPPPGPVEVPSTTQAPEAPPKPEEPNTGGKRPS